MNLNINKFRGFNTWELVPDITDYKWEFMTQKLKNLDEIQYTARIFTIMLRHSFLLN